MSLGVAGQHPAAERQPNCEHDRAHDPRPLCHPSPPTRESTSSAVARARRAPERRPALPAAPSCELGAAPTADREPLAGARLDADRAEH